MTYILDAEQSNARIIKFEVIEMSYIKIDRKQVFGAEELDVNYMEKIRALYDQRIRAISIGEVTQPLTHWVR
jgi:hypothetical protein